MKEEDQSDNHSPQSREEKGKKSPMKPKKFPFSNKVSTKIPTISNESNPTNMKLESMSTSSPSSLPTSSNRSLNNSNQHNYHQQNNQNSIHTTSEGLSNLSTISYSVGNFHQENYSKSLTNTDLYSNPYSSSYLQVPPPPPPLLPSNYSSFPTNHTANITSITNSSIPSQGLNSNYSSEKTPSKGNYWNSNLEEKTSIQNRSESKNSTNINGNSQNKSIPPYYQSYYNPQTSYLTFHAPSSAATDSTTPKYYSEESKQSPVPVLSFPNATRTDLNPPLRAQSRPEFYIPSSSSAMIPVPYYAFPYPFDYRTMATPNDQFSKDQPPPPAVTTPTHHHHHPAAPAPGIPIYPTFPPGIMSPEQSTMASPYNMAILTPPPAPAVFCGNSPPAEVPQFGPGPPIVTGTKLKGPRGCNLFVFHLPNEITNWDLYLLFRRYGTILSVHIMVNKATGLSKGYGFVSFAFLEDAKSAIEAMDGFRLGKKRLKVQLKRLQDDTSDDFNWEDVDVEQETNEILASAQTSGSSTSHPSPSKPINDHKHHHAATTTAIKVQDAAMKLGEMSLLTPAQVTKSQFPKGKNGTKDSKP